MTGASGGVTISKRWIWTIFVAAAFTLTASKRLIATGSASDPGWVLDLAAAAVAAWAVRWGFRQLRKKNMIENVPSSPIRSVAMGLAEIRGRAAAGETIAAPLSGAPCVYYRYLVEEERSGRRGREWVTVEQGASSSPFTVEDGTGRLQVGPQGADIIIGRDYRTVARDAGWLSRRKRRSEWRIHPGDAIYVIGTVSKRRDLVAEHRLRLQERLQQIKRDPGAIGRFDLDGDGTIGQQEWAGAVAVVKNDLLLEEAGHPADPNEDLCLGKGEVEDTFLISDRDERALAAALGWKALGAVLLGGAGIVVLTASLLGRFGLLPGGWTFPWEQLFS